MVIFGNASPESSALLPIAKQDKVLTFNQAPTTTSGKASAFPYNFDLSPSTTNYVRAFVSYTKGKGAKKVAIFAGNDAYGTAIGKSMNKEAKADGLTVTDSVNYKVTALTFTSTLSALQSSKPQLVWADAYGAPAGYMMQDLQKIGWTVPVLGDDSFSVSTPITTPPPTGNLGTSALKNLKFQTVTAGVYKPPSQTPKNTQTMLNAMKRNGSPEGVAPLRLRVRRGAHGRLRGPEGRDADNSGQDGQAGRGPAEGPLGADRAVPLVRVHDSVALRHSAALVVQLREAVEADHRAVRRSGVDSRVAGAVTRLATGGTSWREPRPSGRGAHCFSRTFAVETPRREGAPPAFPGRPGLRPPGHPVIYNLMVVDQLTDDEVDRIFGALADATRRDILSRAIRQEQSVSALAGHYEMSFAAVQKHVAVLERATLVTKQRHGREQIVHANTSTLRRAGRPPRRLRPAVAAAGRTDRRHPRRRERNQPMTVISSTKDPAALTLPWSPSSMSLLTLTVVADSTCPRPGLGGVGGPPQAQALVGAADVSGHLHSPRLRGRRGVPLLHDRPGAGETPRGWWRMEALDKPHRLEFANGLAGDDGEPAPGVEPMPGYVTFEAVDGGTRMTAVVQFVDADQMETMLGMGMQEGMSLAMGQIDALLSPAPV